MSSWKDDFAQAINSYEFEATIPSTGQVVRFKPVDTQTLKKLVIYEKSDDYTAIEHVFDELITNTVIEPVDLDIDSMLIFDRQSLLMDIRGKSKGSNIQQPFTCDKCKSQSVQTLKLDQLPFKKYTKPENNYIEVVPGIGVQIGHVTRQNQKDAYAYLNNDKNLDKNTKEALTPLYVLGAAITAYVNKDGINNDLSFEDKMFILEKLPDTVLEKLRDWLEANQFGYEIKFSYKCPHCGYTEEKKLDSNAGL